MIWSIDKLTLVQVLQTHALMFETWNHLLHASPMKPWILHVNSSPFRLQNKACNPAGACHIFSPTWWGPSGELEGWLDTGMPCRNRARYGCWTKNRGKTPQNWWFIMENPIKKGWFGGYPLFLETPISWEFPQIMFVGMSLNHPFERIPCITLSWRLILLWKRTDPFMFDGQVYLEDFVKKYLCYRLRCWEINAANRSPQRVPPTPQIVSTPMALKNTSRWV